MELKLCVLLHLLSPNRVSVFHMISCSFLMRMLYLKIELKNLVVVALAVTLVS